tara:strand:- start:5330 stop:6157 length:828 start_codon:yes stop_codon:yes gene_type:complete
MPTNGTFNTQNALAGLRKWKLERDDSQTIFPHRIYKDEVGNIYHSVTHILKETAPEWQKDALERWLTRPSSGLERDIACQRGHLTHSHAEYLLKTAAKLARNSANRKGIWRTGNDGLERCPSKVTAWALEKAAQSAPRVSWSASGYARGIRSWILERVSAIHAIEFSIYADGFAGTADALLDVNGVGPFIVDWKTSANARSEELLQSYIDQIGAYSVGLTRLTGIKVKGGAVVVARRSGAPQVRELTELEVRGAEVRFLERLDCYMAQTSLGVNC